MVKILTILALLISVALSSANAQVYSFVYRVGADSVYSKATNVVHANSMGQYVLGLLRERMYSNFYYRGFADKSNTFYKWDLHEVDMKDTLKFSPDDSTKRHPSYGQKISSVIKFGYDKEISVQFDRKNKTAYTLLSDSISGSYYLSDEPCRRVEGDTLINGWSCIKWTPENQLMADKVFIWTSIDVPQQVNFGVFNSRFKGGIVRVEWPNGRFNQLERFELLKKPYYFNVIPTKSFPDEGLNLLKSSLFDDLFDSMYSKE